MHVAAKRSSSGNTYNDKKQRACCSRLRDHLDIRQRSGRDKPMANVGGVQPVPRQISIRIDAAVPLRDAGNVEAAWVRDDVLKQGVDIKPNDSNAGVGLLKLRNVRGPLLLEG